ncbi:hypothetical protein, partial [Cloacibacillus evryensis]|uniref:hypothetical protein n=1 Tax=Cloacibacillus evryensis TaxID=508460 RepID=UPI00210CE76E
MIFDEQGASRVTGTLLFVLMRQRSAPSSSGEHTWTTLGPFIGWGIFIMGLMQKEFDALHLGYTDFETFVRVI